MSDIIPSFYKATPVRGIYPNNGGMFDNNLLRIGEIKTIIYPEDKKSRSRKFIEYDVLVQHRGNGTAVTKLYNNCLAQNSMGGLADYCVQLFRAPEQNQTTGTQVSPINLGNGSKVLLLCINGDQANPVIIGGIRDHRQDDKGRKAKGVHMDWEFNGVHLNISDDGSFSVEYKGPTKAEGKPDAGKGSSSTAGTKISVANDGTFTVATKDQKQSVVIDHKAGTITVTGDKDLTLHAEKIHIGNDAGEKAVLGDTLVSLLEELIDAITTQTHPTPTGPSGPPINAAKFKVLKSRLKTALSQFITVKKTP